MGRATRQSIPKLIGVIETASRAMNEEKEEVWKEFRHGIREILHVDCPLPTKDPKVAAAYDAGRHDGIIATCDMLDDYQFLVVKGVSYLNVKARLLEGLWDEINT